VDRVDDEGSDDFTTGQIVVLGIHSPSRTFPGGVAKGQSVRLQLHWRRLESGERRYYRVSRAR